MSILLDMWNGMSDEEKLEFHDEMAQDISHIKFLESHHIAGSGDETFIVMELNRRGSNGEV